MRLEDKIKDAMADTDLMDFGKYINVPLQDVPASYLYWMWEQDWLKPKYPRLWAYIHNSLDAIKMELKNK